MRSLLSFGLGALAMYLLEEFIRGRRVEREAEARRAVRTQLEPDKPTETPESAQHLGR